MDGRSLAEALREAGYEPYPYSGRMMYGRRCVAVDLGSSGELFKLGYDLGVHGADEPGRPTTDSMGLGIVAYWPSSEWP